MEKAGIDGTFVNSDCEDVPDEVSGMSYLAGHDEISPEDNDVTGETGTALSAETVTETLRKVEAKRKRLRRKCRAMADGPRYHRSPMVCE